MPFAGDPMRRNARESSEPWAASRSATIISCRTTGCWAWKATSAPPIAGGGICAGLRMARATFNAEHGLPEPLTCQDDRSNWIATAAGTGRLRLGTHAVLCQGWRCVRGQHGRMQRELRLRADVPLAPVVNGSAPFVPCLNQPANHTNGSTAAVRAWLDRRLRHRVRSRPQLVCQDRIRLHRPSEHGTSLMATVSPRCATMALSTRSRSA